MLRRPAVRAAGGIAPVTVADASPAAAAPFSNGRLAAALALTALPVVLTTLFFLLPGPLVGAARRRLGPLYLSLAVYAAANWLTFAVVVGVAGWDGLRAHGLRFPVTGSRIAAAVVGFVGALLVFSGVSWFLARVGLPPVRGMDFVDPSAVQVSVLVLSAVVTAPFCEEVLFRVLWIGGLRSRVPAWVAAAISMVAFATIHLPYFGVGGAIFIVVWAVIPAAMFIWFGDLTAPLIMHVMNNLFAYIVVPLLS